MDDKSFYLRVTQENLNKKVEHWFTLGRFRQYRLPNLKTLVYLKPGNYVLDWGAGNGHFSYFLVRQNFKTMGYSFEDAPHYLSHETLCQHVKANPNEPVKLPFPDGIFDAVVSCGVLEHVHEAGGNQAGSMKEIFRILKNDGMFLCFHLPNKASWIELMVEVVNLFLKNKKHVHSKKYFKGEFMTLAADSGFKVVEGGRYNIVPRNWLNAIPGWVSNNEWFVRTYDFFDDLFGVLMSPLCQNWYFILKKGR